MHDKGVFQTLALDGMIMFKNGVAGRLLPAFLGLDAHCGMQSAT